MTRRAWLLLALTLALPVAVWQGVRAAMADRWEARVDAPGAKRVLVVGNSQTFVNDVPRLVAELARAAGDAPFGYRTLAGPGMRLTDHLAGDALGPALDARPWDVVVLQEQSARSAVEEIPYRAAAVTLAQAVRARGGEPLLVEFWGYGDGSPPLAEIGFPSSAAMRAQIAGVVARVAEATGARTIPVGGVVSDLLRARPDLGIWQADGVHASRLGSYASACVHYAVIYGRPVAGNPYDAGLAEAAAVQAAVDAHLCAAGRLPGCPQEPPRRIR